MVLSWTQYTFIWVQCDSGAIHIEHFVFIVFVKKGINMIYLKFLDEDQLLHIWSSFAISRIASQGIGT